MRSLKKCRQDLKSYTVGYFYFTIQFIKLKLEIDDQLSQLYQATKKNKTPDDLAKKKSGISGLHYGVTGVTSECSNPTVLRTFSNHFVAQNKT